jgi:CheY-specific phosphatase CheX
MKTKIEKALKDATISTFEDTCFMYLEPELEDIQKDLTLEAAAEVKYRGDFNGKLIIEARGGLSSAIAANILSNDLPGSQQKMDALGEIANIICGNILPYLSRRGQGFKIESPSPLKVDELLKEGKQEKPLAEVTLNFSEGRADVKFFVDGDFTVKEKKG